MDSSPINVPSYFFGYYNLQNGVPQLKGMVCEKLPYFVCLEPANCYFSALYLYTGREYEQLFHYYILQTHQFHRCLLHPHHSYLSFPIVRDLVRLTSPSRF